MEIRELKTLSQADRTTDALQENAAQAITTVNELLKLIRPSKPSFRSGSVNNVLVEASSASPKVFKIGNAWHEITSEILCDLRRTGAGGLDRGSMAANSCYYLYAVYVDRRVQLVASLHPPTIGPEIAAEWTYLGAFLANAASVVAPFVSVGGRYFANTYWGGSGSIQTTTPTAYTISPLPTTASAVWGLMSVFSTTIGDLGFAHGTDSSLYSALESLTQAGAGVSIETYGWVPLLASPTIYLRVNNVRATVRFWPSGWQESPEEWK